MVILRQKVAQTYLVIFWAIFLKNVVPKSFGRYFPETKCAQRLKISPNWRNFAQSGHTDGHYVCANEMRSSLRHELSFAC
jgi:hypothetical protein